MKTITLSKDEILMLLGSPDMNKEGIQEFEDAEPEEYKKDLATIKSLQTKLNALV